MCLQTISRKYLDTCDFDQILVKQCKYNIWYNKVNINKNFRHKFYDSYNALYNIKFFENIIFFKYIPTLYYKFYKSRIFYKHKN